MPVAAILWEKYLLQYSNKYIKGIHYLMALSLSTSIEN